MNRQSWVRLAYSRPGGPVVLILLFIVCSTPFLLLGSLLNTSYGPITALPLYPNAQAITLTTKGTVGVSGTPTTVKALPPNSIPNYKFTTTDAFDLVVHFYISSLEKTYGAQAVQIESAGPSTFVIHGVRQVFSGQAAERTTVTISTGSDGLTHVEVNVEPR